MSLEYCRNELRSIIRELESIENGVRSDFVGIGSELCADCLQRVENKYEYVLQKLNNVDTNRLADWILGDD